MLILYIYLEISKNNHIRIISVFNLNGFIKFLKFNDN